MKFHIQRTANRDSCQEICRGNCFTVVFCKFSGLVRQVIRWLRDSSGICCTLVVWEYSACLALAIGLWLAISFYIFV